MTDTPKPLPSSPAQEATPFAVYRCRTCGTRWLFWGGQIEGMKPGTWNLLDQFQRPGSCCDNAPMGDQMEFLRDIVARRPAASPARAPQGAETPSEEFLRGYAAGAVNCKGSVDRMDAMEIEIHKLRAGMIEHGFLRVCAIQGQHARWECGIYNQAHTTRPTEPHGADTAEPPPKPCSRCGTIEGDGVYCPHGADTAEPPPTWQQVAAWLTEHQRFLRHSQRCSADQFASQGCDCGLWRLAAKIVSALSVKEST